MNNNFEDLYNYVWEFYGSEGISPIENISPEIVHYAIDIYIDRIARASDIKYPYYTYGGGDSLDRERIRDIIFNLQEGPVERGTKYYGSFTDDEDKMRDFFEISRKDFLGTYEYITPEEYDATLKEVNVDFPNWQPEGEWGTTSHEGYEPMKWEDGNEQGYDFDKFGWSKFRQRRFGFK